MKTIILSLATMLVGTASIANSAESSALTIASAPITLSGEACRSMTRANLTENENGEIGVQVKFWYTSAGGATGRNKEIFRFSAINDGAFQKDQNELFYISGGSKYAVADLNDSFFAVYKWTVKDSVKIQLLYKSAEDNSRICTIQPVLSIE